MSDYYYDHNHGNASSASIELSNTINDSSHINGHDEPNPAALKVSGSTATVFTNNHGSTASVPPLPPPTLDIESFVKSNILNLKSYLLSFLQLLFHWYGSQKRLTKDLKLIDQVRVQYYSKIHPVNLIKP